MRIIAGKFRSRRIQTLRGMGVRPTPDRLREALFNVLAARIPDSIFLDAYAGCGSVGIEALSRGAGRVIFVEKTEAAAGMIRRNLASLGVTDGFEIRRTRASKALARETADIVFLDPPYPLEREYGLALEALAANPPPLTVVQHSSRFELAGAYGPLTCTRTLRQGDNTLSFFERSEADSTSATEAP